MLLCIIMPFNSSFTEFSVAMYLFPSPFSSFCLLCSWIKQLVFLLEFIVVFTERNGEEFSYPIFFGVDSPPLNNYSYSPQLQASSGWVVVCKCFIRSLVKHMSREFWILSWALSFIIWPNLCKFSQEFWGACIIQRLFPVKYQNQI